MSEENYPGLMERVKAYTADIIVVVGLMFIISSVFSQFEDVPNNARIFSFVFIFVLYDPFFTSFFGGTLGHMANGIRVKRENNENKNVNFLLASVRFLIKTLLGWMSLVAISGNAKGKAIHDLAVGSVVIYAKSQRTK